MLTNALICLAVWFILSFVFLRSTENGDSYSSMGKLGHTAVWYILALIALIASFVYFLAGFFFLLVNLYFVPTMDSFFSALATAIVCVLFSVAIAKRMEEITAKNKNKEVVL